MKIKKDFTRKEESTEDDKIPNRAIYKESVAIKTATLKYSDLGRHIRL